MTAQGLLGVALTFSSDPLFSTLSSATVPAFAVSMMVLGLLQIRQVHYSHRLAVGTILLMLLAYSIHVLVLIFSTFYRASVPAFFSTDFSVAVIGLAGLVWWVHAKKTFQCKKNNDFDLGKISVKYSAVIVNKVTDEIAELNFLLESAEKKNLHQKRLMAYISHDLRAPLATIAGHVQLLRGIGTPEQQKHVLAIERNIVYQRELVDELLDNGRAELGLLALRPVTLDLPSLIEDLSRHATLLAAARGNQTIFEISEILPQWVLMDGNRLTQVLLNLLSNAASATHQGVITLRVGGQNIGARWLLQFSVSDTGPGIALEDQARLLEGFQQPTSATAGLGLGLHIARHIVESMEGRMVLSSQVGKGTSFTFSVEVSDSAAPPGDRRNVCSPADASGAVNSTDFIERQAMHTETLTLPSIASMHQLALFAGDGQWSAIQEWLVAAETTQSSCHAFITRIRLLLDELDFPAIQQAATVRTNHPDNDPHQNY